MVKLYEKRKLERNRPKIDLKETGYVGVEWIHVAQD
jgi:hypothetical protein